MNREYVYLIAEKLYLNATVEPLCNRNWLFAIYKALLIANEGDTEPIIWNKYNQWKIDHNCRAAKSAAKTNNTYITHFDLTLDEENCATIKVVFNKKNLSTKPFECLYNSSSFNSQMWEVNNPKNESVLLSAFERDQLYNASVNFSENPEGTEIESIFPGIPVTPHGLPALNAIKQVSKKKSTKRVNEEQVRDMKFSALNLLLDKMRENYNQLTDPNQKSYLEVVIGAAIFYLPTLNSHYNGFISMNALKGYLIKERRVKDHIYPRKLAARELLTGQKLSLEELKKRYHDNLAQFMYITSSENSILVNYYEEHENHDEAMEAL